MVRPNLESSCVIQLNARRSSTVMDELSRLVSVSTPALVFVQEPHIRKGGSVVPLAPGYSWYAVGEAPSAVTYARRDVSLMGVPHLSGDHAVVACAVVDGSTWTTVNCYWRYGDSVEHHASILDGILGSLSTLSSPLLVVGDFNAGSPLWYAFRRDDRGDALVAIASQHRLGIANKEGHAPTWSDGFGHYSNIDVTLVREARVENWRTAPSDTTSDHSVIWFNLKASQPRSGPEQLPDRSRFRLEKANWPAFERTLSQKMTTLPLGCTDAIAASLSHAIIGAAKETIPLAKGRKRPKSWWDGELESQRRMVQRCSEARLRNPSNDNVRNYRYTRNKYVQMLRKKKQDSLIHKIQTEGSFQPFRLLDRLLTPASASRALSVLKDPQGRIPDDIPGAMASLLEALLPLDDSSRDDEQMAGLRRESGVVSLEPFPNVSAPSLEELDDLVKRMPKRRAPGPDDVTPELLKASWRVIRLKFHELCRQAYKEGHFPRPWKQGSLTLIPKANAPGDTPKSFRPLTLLSVPGKIFERTICSRLSDLLKSQNWISPRQFGFQEGLGSTDALLSLKADTEQCDEKYFLVVFLDIASAFDHAWWPLIHARLRDVKCPINLHDLLSSFLEDRDLSFVLGTTKVGRRVDQGCPQGSILGPTFWLLISNPLLTDVELPEGVEVDAYADDLRVKIRANSRRGIESAATAALTAIYNWGMQNRLSFAPHKSCCILLKGKLERRPFITMNDVRVKYVTEHKHLGVLIGERWNLVPHVRDACGRALRSFYQCVNVAQRSYPFHFNTLKLIYQVKFVSIALYAAPVWAHPMKYDIAESLLRSQRLALIMVTRAYRTTSRPALNVLSGCPPLDLVATRLAKGWRSDSQTRTSLKKDVLNEWQTRWEQAVVGRTTFYLFPSVFDRLKARWFIPDKWVSQVFTGHGAFRAYLMERGQVGTPLCPDCSELDTATHALLFCPALPVTPPTSCLRALLHASSGKGHLSLDDFLALREHATAVLRRRAALRL